MPKGLTMRGRNAARRGHVKRAIKYAESLQERSHAIQKEWKELTEKKLDKQEEK